MTLFLTGAALMALGILIIFAVRRPEDKDLPRDYVVSRIQVLLSNLVLVLVLVGGAMMALAVI